MYPEETRLAEMTDEHKNDISFTEGQIYSPLSVETRRLH